MDGRTLAVIVGLSVTESTEVSLGSGSDGTFDCECSSTIGWALRYENNGHHFQEGSLTEPAPLLVLF